MTRPFYRFALAAGTLCLTALTGCTLNSNPASTSADPVAFGTIRGQAFGGNQAVVGATVTVYAAATTAYGAASTQLGTTTTTDSQGSFNLQTGTGYTCTAGQQVYLYVNGGNTGAGTNVNASFLAVLGQCPAGGGNLASVTPFVYVNEVSTVAAAYALSGFAVDATHVADDEAATVNTTAAIAKVGMANAFGTANMLAPIGTGVANTTTGNSTASGQTAAIVVPQAQIDTIANVLAACVNNASTVATPAANCTTLFGAATSDGTATGTKPTETATAAINIAHHPAANVGTLYGLVGPSAGAPFQPSATGQPADFTISILYPQGGTGTVGIAIDGQGVAYGAYGGGNVVYRITPNGTQTTLAVTAPRRLAIDPANNVWVPSTAAATTNPNISEFVGGAGTAVTYFAVDTASVKLASVGTLAFDQNDYLWALAGGTVKQAALLNFPVTNAQGNAVVSVTGLPTNDSSLAVSPTTGNLGITSGTTTAGALSIYTDGGAQVGAAATYTGGGLYTPIGIISDATGNFWIGNSASTSSSTVNAAVSEFNGSTGASVAGTNGYAITPPSGDVSSQLYSGEFDGAGLYYTGGAQTYATGTTTPTLGAIYQFNGSGTQVAVFVPPTGNNQYFAVDPSGNLWFGGNKTIGEMIGVASPKVTPLVVANFPGLVQATPVTGISAAYPNKVATRP